MSYRTGIKEQLAALLVETDTEMAIHGTPGDWSVCIPNDLGSLWLASSRRPSQIRCFKTMDAAHAAAIEIARMADPTCAFVVVRVCMAMSECAKVPQ